MPLPSLLWMPGGKLLPRPSAPRRSPYAPPDPPRFPAATARLVPSNPSLSLRPSASRAGVCRWLPALLATAVVLSGAAAPGASPPPPPPPEGATMEDVPQTLSGGGEPARRIQRPRSRQAETCTVKCLGTCIRGGAGSPGEGPLNIRKPLVVFKPGFRSRNYCLVECSDICNLIKDGDDGP